MTDKVRAQTIQQKLGFADSDLKTPRHDEIMLWLDKHALDVVVATVGNQWTEQDIDWLNEELKKHHKPTITLADLPPRKPLELISVTWEYPIKSGTYVVGFIDLVIQYDADSLTLNEYDYSYTPCRSRFIICVEVKSSIPSAGELIRQIQLYRQYQKGTYVVVSPDARYADVLRSQGIEFYHYQVDAYEEAMK